jgi:hypothetical protein
MAIVMTIARQVATHGFAIIADVLARAEAEALLRSLESAGGGAPAAGRGGIRNLLDRVPAVRDLADSKAVRALVDPVLGSNAFAARGILFDKIPGANWKVPWHQDLTIAVQTRVDAPGFGPWTVKDGVPHVQPPTAILTEMLAVRIHLDDCSEVNGPLRVVPGSHAHGRLSAARVQSIQEASVAVCCTAGQGSVVLMRPLLLHASSAASAPGHRRVIHLEFAASSLPAPLQWYESAEATAYREGKRADRYRPAL